MTRAVDPPVFTAAMKDLGKGAAAAGLVGLFVNILHLAMPLYSIQIYDRVIHSGSFDTLVALTGLVGVILVFQAILDFLRGRIFTILGARLAAGLGAKVFEAAVETTLRHGAGAAAGAVRDLTEVRNFVAGGLIALPLDMAVAPLLLFVLFLMHPVYGMVGLGGVLVLVLMAIVAELLARRPSARASQTAGRVQAETTAAIRNAEVITAMGMLPDVTRRWQLAQAQALDATDQGRAKAKALAATAKGLRMGLQVAIIAAGATLVIDRTASAGTIIAAAVILSRLLLPFEQTIDGWRQWIDALAAFERLRDVLRRGASTRSQEPIKIANGRLQIDRVSYVPAGQDRPVLRNVSFALNSGEMIGVIGASGAGKSSLARLIVGLWQPTTGNVFLDGQSTFSHERGSFGAAVGYLPQEPMLFDATVRENIARFRDGHMADVVAAARMAGVHELIGSLPQGYETRLTDAGSRLSGGQRQRLALARAIFGNPRLIVLDEPNSSLDSEGEAALVETIDALRDRGATILVIAQRMSILKRADRLIVMKDGIMSKIGGHAEVMSSLGPQRHPGISQEPGPLRKLKS